MCGQTQGIYISFVSSVWSQSVKSSPINLPLLPYYPCNKLCNFKNSLRTTRIKAAFSSFLQFISSRLSVLKKSRNHWFYAVFETFLLFQIISFFTVINCYSLRNGVRLPLAIPGKSNASDNPGHCFFLMLLSKGSRTRKGASVVRESCGLSSSERSEALKGAPKDGRLAKQGC